MAEQDDVQGRQTSRRTRSSRKTSPVPDNDWPGTDESVATFSPRRTLHGDIDASKVGSISSGAHRRPGPTAKVPTTPTRSSLTRSSSMSTRNPSAAAPGLPRAATVPHHHRWPAYIYEEEDNSRSDSRRSGSRRDVSPPSAHLYRSMAGSRKSSRTSLSESDADLTTSTQEETARKVVHSTHVHTQPSPPPRVPAPPKSRKDVIYEEDIQMERRERRPRLRREDTLIQEEERRQPRPKARRDELLYPDELERECDEHRPKPRRGELLYDVDSEAEPLPKPRRGEVIYEEDCEVPPKYNPFLDRPRTPPREPSRAPSRAASRAPSSMQDKHRSLGKEHRRSSTIDEPQSRSRSRQRLSKRYASH